MLSSYYPYFNVTAIQKNHKTIEIQQLFPVPKGQINKLKEEIWSPLGADRFLTCLEEPKPKYPQQMAPTGQTLQKRPGARVLLKGFKISKSQRALPLLHS